MEGEAQGGEGESLYRQVWETRELLSQVRDPHVLPQAAVTGEGGRKGKTRGEWRGRHKDVYPRLWQVSARGETVQTGVLGFRGLGFRVVLLKPKSSLTCSVASTLYLRYGSGFPPWLTTMKCGDPSSRQYTRSCTA